MKHINYHPLPQEYIATGLIGIALYVVIIYFSAVSIRLGIRSKSTKRFFVAVIFMSALELPRFLVMTIQQNYNSRTTYCLHLAAGIFFFVSFSIVCRQWSGLLQLGSYFRAVYGLRALIASNVLFASVDVISIILCATSRSLRDFFDSPGFAAITLIEGIRNCVYSGFLSFYGVKLVRRFWHFSRLERQASTHKSILMYLCYCCSGSEQSTYAAVSSAGDNSSGGGGKLAGTGIFGSHGISPQHEAVFTKVVLRMTSVLILSSACFLCRVCMLIAKMIALHHYQDRLTTPSFTLFGFFWFLFSDFIPRALPTLAFIFLMRTKRPAREIKDSVQHKTPSGQDDFQFSRLALTGGGSDDPFDLDSSADEDLGVPGSFIGLGYESAGASSGTGAGAGNAAHSGNKGLRGALSGMRAKAEVMLHSDRLYSPSIRFNFNPKLKKKAKAGLAGAGTGTDYYKDGVDDNDPYTDLEYDATHGYEGYDDELDGVTMNELHSNPTAAFGRDGSSADGSTGPGSTGPGSSSRDDKQQQPRGTIPLQDFFLDEHTVASGAGGIDGGTDADYTGYIDDEDDVSSVEDAEVDRFFDILTLNAASTASSSK